MKKKWSVPEWVQYGGVVLVVIVFVWLIRDNLLLLLLEELEGEVENGNIGGGSFGESVRKILVFKEYMII